jgi:hypothetical protein
MSLRLLSKDTLLQNIVEVGILTIRHDIVGFHRIIEKSAGVSQES